MLIVLYIMVETLDTSSTVQCPDQRVAAARHAHHLSSRVIHEVVARTFCGAALERA